MKQLSNDMWLTIRIFRPYRSLTICLVVVKGRVRVCLLFMQEFDRDYRYFYDNLGNVDLRVLFFSTPVVQDSLFEKTWMFRKNCV